MIYDACIHSTLFILFNQIIIFLNIIFPTHGNGARLVVGVLAVGPGLENGTAGTSIKRAP